MARPIFSCSSNTTGRVKTLLDPENAGLPLAFRCNHDFLEAEIYDIYTLPVFGGQPVTLTSELIYTSLTVLLDPENVGVAFGILLSCLQAEIYVMAYALPVYGGHLYHFRLLATALTTWMICSTS